jgi:hypothetical protein
MRMRWLVAVLALGLAACDVSTSSSSDSETASADTYTIEIRAEDLVQTYLITAPDGRTVGARASEGASALMDATRARSLAAEAPPQNEELSERVAIRLPGFEMTVAGQDDGTDNGDSGQVRISVGGGDGQHVTVNADEGGPGEADDRAYVRITGADADAVRNFVAEQEDLSAEVKQQLLTELALAPASEN